jgi:hypothetical protein
MEAKVKKSITTKAPRLRKEKKMEQNLKIPTYDEYEIMKEGNNKYNLLQIKEICRFYKQKLTGKKEQLAENLYNYLYKSKYALVIQNKWRKYYIKVYNKYRGPARLNRSICVNETDFYTLEPLIDIPYLQFFSYCDKVIYGFDILSLFILMKDEYGNQDEEKLRNPYTREPFPDKVKESLINLIKASKKMGDKIITRVVDEQKVIPSSIMVGNENILVRQQVSARTISLFNEINDLGNYTLSTWFSELSHPLILKFVRELYDIWTYRANLSDIVKREICPPLGNPFRPYHINTNMLMNLPIEPIKLFVLELIEPFIRNGINRDSRYLGANYVLCALTLVSPEAAEALPWLYQSVSTF